MFEDEVAQPAEKHHINFWSSFEKSAHNPEREVCKSTWLMCIDNLTRNKTAVRLQPEYCLCLCQGRLLRFATCTLRYAEWVQEEKKKIARKRGDPKTQTSDARFDAQFAVMHGLAGQAPWYARPQQSMYATETVQQPELQAGTTKPGVPASRGHHESGGHTRAEPRSSRDHAGTHRGDRRERGPRKPKDAAQHASFDMASARSDLASMVGQGSIAYAAHSEKRSKEKDTVKHRHKDKHKHKHRGERSKSSGHRMREAADRSRSRSPKAGDKRSKSRRRDASSSGSDSDRERSRGRDAGTHRGSPAVAAQSTGVKNKFEHLRRERLEREKAEAQRARALLKQHYSR